MWKKESYTGSSCDVFKREGIDEELESTRCPNCNFEMVVPDDAFEGLDLQDAAISRRTAIRGI